jgi:uncharacterized protein
MNLTLVLTHDCNLNCNYCYADCGNPTYMSIETAQRAIDFCFDESIRQKNSSRKDTSPVISLFGGEPLLNWKVFQGATEYAETKSQKLDMDVSLFTITNGTLLTKQRIEWLKRNNVAIHLSLDGNPDMHNSNRTFKNGSGSHESCIKSLAMIMEEGIDPDIILVADPSNVEYLSDSINWMAEAGIKKIALTLNYFAEWNEDTIDELHKGHETASEVFIESYRKGVPLEINFLNDKISSKIEDRSFGCNCSAVTNNIAVTPNGDIFPCERFITKDSDEFVIGNLQEGLNKERIQSFFKKRGITLSECDQCEMRNRCYRCCSGINYHLTGSLKGVSGIICFYQRLCFEIADRTAETLYNEANPLFLNRFYS